MAVIVLLQSAISIPTLVDHAVWAARRMQTSIRFVAISPDAANNPALEFDAYGRLDTQHDMLAELIASERVPIAPDVEWGVRLVQAAAKSAKDAGATDIKTDVIDDHFLGYVESATDTTDLLVVSQGELDHDRLMHVHRRMILIVPEVFAEIETWLLVYTGSGRPIEFLANTGLLSDLTGTAIVAGEDGQTRLHFRDAMQHLGNVGYVPATHELRGNAEDVAAAVVAVTSPSMVVASIGAQDGLRSRLGRGGLLRYVREFAGPVLMAVD